MNKPFVRGLLTALAYYAVGSLVVVLAYAVWGQQNAHAPGAYHLVILLVWLGGCLWGFSSFVKLLRRVRTAFQAGVFLIHLLLTLGPLIWINHESGPSDRESYVPSPQADITTEVKGDTAIIRYYGSILYIQVGDSVLFDQLSMRYSPDSILRRRPN